MFPVETLNKIQATAVQAAGARIVKIDGESRKVLIDANGVTKEYELPAPTIKAEVRDLEDLIRFATADGVPEPRSIWHSYDQVTLLLDDTDRRDTVTMPLPKTSLFLWLLRSGNESNRFTQRELLAFFKTELAEAVTEEQKLDFVSVLQSIKFRKADETDSDLSKRGTEGLGRKIENECTGADKLPEFLNVTTSLYRNVKEVPPVTFPVYVSIDFENQQFVLKPVSDTLETAIDGAQLILGEAIRSKIRSDKPADGQDIKVYFGKP